MGFLPYPSKMSCHILSSSAVDQGGGSFSLQELQFPVYLPASPISQLIISTSSVRQGKYSTQNCRETNYHTLTVSRIDSLLSSWENR